MCIGLPINLELHNIFCFQTYNMHRPTTICSSKAIEQIRLILLYRTFSEPEQFEIKRLLFRYSITF